MGIVRRQGFFNTLITFGGTALGFVNIYLLLPRFLDEAEYGFFALLPYLGMLFSQVATLGFGGIVLRFFPYFDDRKRGHNGFFTFGLILVSSGLVITAILAVVLEPLMFRVYEDRSPLLVDYYLLVVPLGFAATLHLALESYLQGVLKTVIPSFIRDVGLRLGVTVDITLFALGVYGFRGFLWVYIGINVLAFLSLLAYLLYLRQIQIRFTFGFRLRRLWRSMLGYGGVVFLHTASTYIYQLVDNLMLAAYLNLNVVGVYRLILFMLQVVAVPARSMNKVVYPLIGKHWKNRDLPAIAELYQKVSLANVLAGGLILGLILINAETLLTPPLIDERFLEGKTALFILAVSTLFAQMTGVTGYIILVSKYSRFSLAFSFSAVILTVLTNYLLIPRFGLNGAAIATAITIIINQGGQLIFVKWKFDLWPFHLNTFYSVSLIVLMIMGGLFLPDTGIFILDLGYKSLLLSLVYITVFLRLNFSPDFRDLTRRLLQVMRMEGLYWILTGEKKAR